VLARQRAYFGNFDPVGDVDPILESMLASLLICPSGGLVIVLSSPFGAGHCSVQPLWKKYSAFPKLQISL
jgi:hypothetical protein